MKQLASGSMPERVASLLKETILVMCKSSLQYDIEVSVEGLLGITLDKKDIFLVNIKELIQNEKAQKDSSRKETSTREADSSRRQSMDDTLVLSSSDDSVIVEESSSARKRRRRRLRFGQDNSAAGAPAGNTQRGGNAAGQPALHALHSMTQAVQHPMTHRMIPGMQVPNSPMRRHPLQQQQYPRPGFHPPSQQMMQQFQPTGNAPFLQRMSQPYPQMANQPNSQPRAQQFTQPGAQLNSQQRPQLFPESGNQPVPQQMSQPLVQASMSQPIVQSITSLPASPQLSQASTQPGTPTATATEEVETGGDDGVTVTSVSSPIQPTLDMEVEPIKDEEESGAPIGESSLAANQGEDATASDSTPVNIVPSSNSQSEIPASGTPVSSETMSSIALPQTCPPASVASAGTGQPLTTMTTLSSTLSSPQQNTQGSSLSRESGSSQRRPVPSGFQQPNTPHSATQWSGQYSQEGYRSQQRMYAPQQYPVRSPQAQVRPINIVPMAQGDMNAWQAQMDQAKRASHMTPGGGNRGADNSQDDVQIIETITPPRSSRQSPQRGYGTSAGVRPPQAGFMGTPPHAGARAPHQAGLRGSPSWAGARGPPQNMGTPPQGMGTQPYHGGRMPRQLGYMGGQSPGSRGPGPAGFMGSPSSHGSRGPPPTGVMGSPSTGIRGPVSAGLMGSPSSPQCPTPPGFIGSPSTGITGPLTTGAIGTPGSPGTMGPPTGPPSGRGTPAGTGTPPPEDTRSESPRSPTPPPPLEAGGRVIGSLTSVPERVSTSPCGFCSPIKPDLDAEECPLKSESTSTCSQPPDGDNLKCQYCGLEQMPTAEALAEHEKTCAMLCANLPSSPLENITDSLEQP